MNFSRNNALHAHPPALDFTDGLRAELTGSDTATAVGITVHATAPVLALCRKLVDAGHDPRIPLAVYRGETLALRIQSIGECAKLTVEEGNRPPHFRPWRPMPSAEGSAAVRPKPAGAS